MDKPHFSLSCANQDAVHALVWRTFTIINERDGDGERDGGELQDVKLELQFSTRDCTFYCKVLPISKE